VSKSATARLQDYAWPGNVRELRNVCERLAILLAGRTIEESNLPREITTLQPPSTKSHFALPEGGVDLEKVELDLIQQALARTNGNRSRSARLLGISRDTLLYRMQKHHLR
jgi:DNA-binding NtrC family response regulator